MKLLVVGKGGREHALVWKLAQSPRVERVYCAPGNAGTAVDGVNVPIEATDFDRLLRFAKKEDIALTVVGPEEPLSLGIVDLFQQARLRIFGPSRQAAQIEASKVFAKQLMRHADVRTTLNLYGDAFTTDMRTAHEKVVRMALPKEQLISE